MIAADEARRSRRCESLLVEHRFGTEQVVVEEHLVGERGVAAGACATARGAAARLRPGLQADLRRRPRAEHRRHGVLLAGSGGRRGSLRGAVRATVHQPVLDELRRRGIDFHGVLYAGLMMTADGPAGARVQHPLRRPRDAGDPAAAAQRPAGAAVRGRRSPAALAGSSLEWIGADRRHRRARECRLPRVVVERRCDQRPRARAGDDVFVTHAGTAFDRLAARSSRPADACCSVTALGDECRRRPRQRICCRRHDRVRRQADAARHRRAGEVRAVSDEPEQAARRRWPRRPRRLRGARRRRPRASGS